MVANGSEPREILLDPMIAGSRGADGCEFDREVDRECSPRVDSLDMMGSGGIINLPISPPHKAKSTLSTPLYPTSPSNQKPGVGLDLRLWGAAARQWGPLFNRTANYVLDRNLNF